MAATLPSFFQAATSTATYSVEFSQRAEPDREHSIGCVDANRSITADVAADDSIAVDHPGIRRPIHHDSLETYRPPAQFQREHAYHPVGAPAGAGNAEYHSFRFSRGCSGLVECQRVQKASLCSGVDREMKGLATLRTHFHKRFAHPRQIAR